MKFIPKEIVVNDLMQSDYRYLLIEPEGKNFDLLFKPELTPKETLSLDIFGGRYMRDCRQSFQKVGLFLPNYFQIMNL